MSKRLKLVERRKRRTRGKLLEVSDPNKYRISIVRTSRNMHAQLIDDLKMVTVAAASTNDPECLSMLDGIKNRRNRKSANVLGKVFGSRVSKIDLSRGVFFDRGASKYCGVVSEFADIVRGFGLKF